MHSLRTYICRKSLMLGLHLSNLTHVVSSRLRHKCAVCLHKKSYCADIIYISDRVGHGNGKRRSSCNGFKNISSCGRSTLPQQSHKASITARAPDMILYTLYIHRGSLLIACQSPTVATTLDLNVVQILGASSTLND